MNIDVKRKYVPCQLDVVEFKVERGYADSTAESGIFTWQGEANMLWSMTADTKNGISHYRNEEYQDGITWFE